MYMIKLNKMIKQTPFFDTFGQKILFGTEQVTRTNNKITLVNLKFNLSACRNLSKNELDNLSDTASDFFKFYSIFWK